MDIDTASVFDAVLNTSMYTEIQFSREDIYFDTYTIKNCDIEYIVRKDDDTVTVKSMALDFKNINFNLTSMCVFFHNLFLLFVSFNKFEELSCEYPDSCQGSYKKDSF